MVIYIVYGILLYLLVILHLINLSDQNFFLKYAKDLKGIKKVLINICIQIFIFLALIFILFLTLLSIFLIGPFTIILITVIYLTLLIFLTNKLIIKVKNKKIGKFLRNLLPILCIFTIIFIATYSYIISYFSVSRHPASYYSKSQMKIFGTALLNFYLDCNRYPTNEEGLEALIKLPSNEDLIQKWKGPYLTGSKLFDPWNRPYKYVLNPNSALHPLKIISLGKDGKKGGDGEDADIIYELDY